MVKLLRILGTLLAIGMVGNFSTISVAQSNQVSADQPFEAVELASFDRPWAMTFLPDGRLLVTEMEGSLKLVEFPSVNISEVKGVPEVAFGGQGGLGDIILDPDFASTGVVYLSYAEAGDNQLSGAAVARAKLTLDEGGGGHLSDLEVIWRQVPKVTGQGHYGHRLAFGPDGKLWITSGDRQKFDPAQDMTANLGKIVRLNSDGTVPEDNPHAGEAGVAAEIWSLGHRNPLGLAFDADGRLWVHEMGPKGGDELNLIKRGGNYGYPLVSNGVRYSGEAFPFRHPERPEFMAPAITWTPVISPAGFIIYSGNRFPDWKGDGVIGGLSAKALIRIELDGTEAREIARYRMEERIREVEQGPHGRIWVLEDGRNRAGGRLLMLQQGTEPADE